MINTYLDAIASGYVARVSNQVLQRGYIRKQDETHNFFGSSKVFVASGSRKGQLYILVHNPTSSLYCIRQYLTKV